jgi:hypothetical protein
LFGLRKLAVLKPEAISIFIHAMSDPDKSVRDEASVCLIGAGEAALPLLLDEMKKAPGDEAEAAAVMLVQRVHRDRRATQATQARKARPVPMATPARRVPKVRKVRRGRRGLLQDLPFLQAELPGRRSARLMMLTVTPRGRHIGLLTPRPE